MDESGRGASGIHEPSNTQLQRQYADPGVSGRVGFGNGQLVLVIDMVRAWIYPASPMGSSRVAGVLKNIATLPQVACRAKLPIFFTTMAFDENIAEVGEDVEDKTSHLSWLIRGSE